MAAIIIPTIEMLDAQWQKQQLSSGIKQDARKFSILIIEAMQTGKDKLRPVYLMPSKAVQDQLRTDFAGFGWTLNFSRIRLGGTISWS